MKAKLYFVELIKLVPHIKQASGLKTKLRNKLSRRLSDVSDEDNRVPPMKTITITESPAKEIMVSTIHPCYHI